MSLAEQIEDEEIRLLRQLSVHDSLQLYASMQKAYEWQLRQSASIFASERHSALIEFQARLKRLNG